MANSSKTFGKLTIPLLVLLTISFSAIPAQAKYGGGTGGPNDPYLILDANQMNAIGADSNDWDKNFLLCADIDLRCFTGTSFNIIGYYVSNYDTKPFTGVFDGNGHTISNFTYTSAGTNYIGLFGHVDGPTAEIKDLGLIDPDVNAGTSSYIGSLAGYLRETTITNCYAERGSVSGNDLVGGLVGMNRDSRITNSYSTGSVAGSLFVGGLVGRNLGTITNCYASSNVSGDERVGGLAGHNFYATITNCYSSCTVTGTTEVGGLVGSNYYDSKIISCYSTGTVTGTTEVGGLVGSNIGYIVLSYWDIETSGVSESDGGEGKSTAEMKGMSTYDGWSYGAAWTIDEGVDYPRLVWENAPGVPIEDSLHNYGGGSGTVSDPYLIYKAEHLNTIGIYPADFACHFKLMADIDLTGFHGSEFNIIGYVIGFSGVFDGNGHTISNFTYTSTDTDYIGLFGYVDDSNAVIKDLGLITPNVDAGTGRRVGSLLGRLQNGTITGCYVESGSVAGSLFVGGLVGRNYDTITSCYSTTSVSGFVYIGGLVGHNDGTITNCYSTNNVTGEDGVGGLAGGNYYGTITNCYSTGSVTGDDHRVGGLVGENEDGSITDCFSTGSVSGDNRIGGLVGKNEDGSITDCFSMGSVIGRNEVGGLVGHNYRGTITNCYSTGGVSGNDDVGGLVGYNKPGEVTNSFWDIETSGQVSSAGGTGLTTDQMQTMSTFTDAGWDFVGETINGVEDIWFIPQQDYPRLWWEGMQVPMKLTPRTLNCRSQGNWVKAHLTLPQGFTVEDVDSNRPAVLRSFGFESAPLYVFVNENELVQIEAAFEREAVCSLSGDWPQMLTVAGFLTDGNIFLGTSTVRMIAPSLKEIGELALYWLNADCVQPDFCNDIDLNRDSMVNLLDYALLLNSQVEFIRE